MNGSNPLEVVGGAGRVDGVMLGGSVEWGNALSRGATLGKDDESRSVDAYEVLDEVTLIGKTDEMGGATMWEGSVEGIVVAWPSGSPDEPCDVVGCSSSSLDVDDLEWA